VDIYREVDVEAEEKWECEVGRKADERGGIRICQVWIRMASDGWRGI